MEKILRIVCALSQADLRRRSDVGLGKLIVLQTRCRDSGKDSRLYRGSHQIVRNLCLRQIVHLRQI